MSSLYEDYHRAYFTLLMTNKNANYLEKFDSRTETCEDR